MDDECVKTQHAFEFELYERILCVYMYFCWLKMAKLHKKFVKQLSRCATNEWNECVRAVYVVEFQK